MSKGDDFADERRNYEIARHPGVLISALKRCQELGCAPPSWVIEGLEGMTEPLASKRPARGKRSPDEIALQYITDHMRGLMVDHLRGKRVPKDALFQEASNQIDSIPEWRQWRGSAEAIRDSYRRYNRRTKRVDTKESGSSTGGVV